MPDMSISESGAEPDGAVQRSRLQFPVVGIGASAGCIQALTTLFSQMPANSGMAFVVIVHLSPKHESNIDHIIATCTSMPVLQVTESVAIEADHVYVISPTHQLQMDDGRLLVSELERPRGRHVAIDTFFRTLAEVHMERAVCIVLSGTGSDGAIGVQRIKECGGVALAQTPSDAEYDGMPHSAIATGAVDFVLPAADMALKLVQLWGNAQRIELPASNDASMRVEHPPTADAAARAEAALHDVMTVLRQRTGHDFAHYKRATVLRRLERRLQVNGVPTLPDYHAFLESHPTETPALLKDLLISVTNFFRDRESFLALERELAALPPPATAAQGNNKLRAWVAGCATGEEAYSVAMLLLEHAAQLPQPPEVLVFASDIDERAIATARAGVYPGSIDTDVPIARLRQFFQKHDGHWAVRRDLREKVLFAAHNILRDPPFSNLDVVCCRNLLIYLDRSVQTRVLEMFHFALNPGGLLFLGTSESADASGDLFVPVDKKHRIYRANRVKRRPRALPNLPLDAGGRLILPFTPPPVSRESYAELHDRLREAYAPPSVLIDANARVMHSTERAGAYLRFAPGQPSQDLLDVVRPALRLELRTAIYQAQEARQSVEARRILVDNEGHSTWVTITARPVENGGARFVLVLFDEVEATLHADATDAAAKDPMLKLLEEELQKTRIQLHGSIGQSATSTEELRASNEELQAINEELRSTTEELETSKEELQSVNEELITVNQELKHKVEETSKVNDDLKNLIASTDIATIFVDRSVRIKRFTPPATSLFNLIASDVGRSLLDITNRLDYRELDEDVAEAFESLHVVEREVRGPNGTTYLVRALPYRTHEDVIDGAVLNFVDISATRRAEQKLREGETRMRMVVESTKDYAIVTTDVTGRVTSWNVGAQRMFGYGEDEMRGETLARIFTESDRAAGAPEHEMRRAHEDGRAVDERWHQRKDGSIFYCSGILAPMFDGSELVGYAKIARDLTDSKRTEAQLEALLLSEKEMRAELQAASALKDDFLAVMSHELKHPLNLIHVNAELLARQPEVRSTSTAMQAADVIRRTVMSQAKIIDDLLDLSRMHTGKMSLEIRSIDWIAIINRVIGAVAGDAERQQLDVTASLDPAAAYVSADPVRVEQMVWNLISNALKFTPRGGTIHLRLSVDQAHARLDVTDTGQGLGIEFLPHVFDLFWQADRGTFRSRGGMGIGLALVKHLAEEHGGRVAVASDGLGTGARFSIWLPLADGPHLAAHETHGASALAGLRILLVDDTVDALETFAALLRLDGAEVTATESAQQALAAAEHGEFDVVVSDVAMPVMDGYQLMEQLRKMPAHQKLHAIALTGFGRPQDEHRAIESGFDAHLTKPTSIETLAETVGRIRRADRPARR